MICKIVMLEKLICQNYMKSIEKRKSQKGFGFTFSIGLSSIVSAESTSKQINIVAHNLVQHETATHFEYSKCHLKS